MSFVQLAHQLHERLEIIRDPEASQATKEREIEHIIAEGEGFFEVIARRYAVYPGLNIHRDFDDLLQIVRERAWVILTEMANGRERKGNFDAQLCMSAHGAIRDFADSGMNTLVARGGAANRASRAQAAREAINESTTPPASNRPIVEFGLQVDRPSDSDAAAHLEMQSVIDRTLYEIARFESATLYEVARTMFAWFPDDEQPSMAEVARRVNIPLRTAVRYVHEVESIFKRAYSEGAERAH